MNNIENNIIQKIKKGEVVMKPRWHFLLQTAFLITSTILMTVLAVYLLSFVVFTLRQQGVWFAPGFGFRGISVFIMSSPWFLISLTIIFLVLLYILVKQYSFSYKRPLVYSMLGVIMFTLIGSYVINQTRMHDRIHSYSERNNVPGIAPLYRSVLNNRSDNVTLGTIVEITTTGFVIETEERELITVVVTEDTRRRPGNEFAVSDEVSVFGENIDGEIEAIGVRLLRGNTQGHR